MEHWQFLIQQQGDRTWRPLESPNLEIESGMYRVVARFNRANTDVEVRVTYSSQEEVPPKRRVYSRSRRTNSEGLMAVIPFTYLNQGIWELRCSGDLMSDMLGKSWQYTIYLQVVPHNTPKEHGDKKEQFQGKQTDTQRIKSPPYSQTPLLTNSPASFDEPASPVRIKAQTAEQILKNLVELALPSAQTLLTDETKVEDTHLAIPDLPLLLTLDKQIYIAHWGETLSINGYVELKQPTLNAGDNLDICDGELRIELRSPQTSEIITQTRQAIPEESLPFTIKCSFEIPGECESKLILADISLYGKVASNVAVLLASQSFTITASVTQLLAISEASTTKEPDTVDNLLQLQMASASPSVSLDLQLLNLVKTAKTHPSLLMRRAPKKFLPPQLAQKLHRQAASPPQLPTLPGQDTQNLFAKSVVAATILEHLKKNDTVASVPMLPTEATFPYLRRIKALASDTQDVESSTPSTPVFQTLEELPHNNTNELDDEDAISQIVYNPQLHNESYVLAPDTSTAATNPQLSPLLRKWIHSQGNSLSQPITLQYQDCDREDTGTILHADAGNKEDTVKTEDKEEFSPTPSLPHSLTPSLTNSPSSSWIAQEIVVYDTFSETEADALKNRNSKHELVASKSDIFSKLTVVESTEPLPVPQLHLHDGELISGNSVRVIVKIPSQRPQVAVKLWIEDCQTRWLLDGPRLLTLLPNFFGGLEVMTHINVPFGCLKIRIEAITVDVATQQESHKVTIVRTVIPPDLPTLQLDELLSM